MEDPAEFFQDSMSLHSCLKAEAKTSLSLFVCGILSYYLVISFKICTPPDEEAMASKACGNKH